MRKPKDALSVFKFDILSDWVRLTGMNSKTNRITYNPKQCGGKPCIRGMRIRVIDVLELLENGLSRQEILEELPDLELEDIQACIAFARKRVDHPVLAV